MDQKQKFIHVYLSGQYTMTECCRLFDISRETGHKMWRRFQEQGLVGLEPRSRAPRHCPHALDAQTVHRFSELRRHHPSWGPVKLIAYLSKRHPEQALPAPSTVGALLKRQGLVRCRKRRARPARFVSELGGYYGPNAVWCADYKGEFRCRNAKLCYPLTISDGYSRAFLRCQGLCSTNRYDAQKVFEGAFREFGLPDAIRTDNGPPFSSPSGISRLSVWWVMLGIRPVRIAPGKPTQNGRHERIHRTLKEDLLNLGVEKNLRAQQRAFDRFIHEYNHQRPHQALGHDTPASRYVPSLKQYPTKLREPHYAEHFKVVRLNAQGELVYNQRRYAISSVLARLPVGIVDAPQGPERLYFGPLILGYFSPKRGFKRGAPLPPKAPTPIFQTPD